MRIRNATMVLAPVAVTGTPLLSAADAKRRPAAQGDSRAPAILGALDACRTVADGQARLACYDDNTAKLAAARESGEVAVIDRQQVREAKRGLFGFNLSKLNIFNIGKSDRSGGDRDDVDEISGKAVAVTRNADGYYVVTLEDGARWEQISPLIYGHAPRAGSTVTIKRAALGSFKMTVDQSPAVKARRIG